MKVLFVCMANINRSQIAAGIFNRLAKGHSSASAGLVVDRVEPGRPIAEYENNPILPMKEAGYDISAASVTRLDERQVKSADKVILLIGKDKHSMDELPDYLRHAHGLEWWDVQSIPEGIPYEEYSGLEKKRIKVIEVLVKDLIKRIGG